MTDIAMVFQISYQVILEEGGKRIILQLGQCRLFPYVKPTSKAGQRDHLVDRTLSTP
jgi:hypothetical protein